MGGVGGNLLGVPWGLGEGGPCLVSPRESNPLQREPLELFPTSASGSPWGGGEVGNSGSGAPMSKPAGRSGSGSGSGPGLVPHCGRARSLAGVRGVCGVWVPAGVDGTFIRTPSHDQRQCSSSTVSFAVAIAVGPEARPQTASLRVSYRRRAQKSERDAGNVGWVTRGTVGSAVILP